MPSITVGEKQHRNSSYLSLRCNRRHFNELTAIPVTRVQVDHDEEGSKKKEKKKRGLSGKRNASLLDYTYF